MYVDIETLLVTWLPTAVTPAPRVGVATPADPANTYGWVANGFVKAQRIGGPGQLGIDRPRVDVQCFAQGYGAAKLLAGKVREALEFRLPGHVGADGTVLGVVTDSGPGWAPYDDVNLSRFVATYTLITHGA